MFYKTPQVNYSRAQDKDVHKDFIDLCTFEAGLADITSKPVELFQTDNASR